MAKKSGPSLSKNDERVLFIVAYVIPIFTGIVVLLINGGRSKRLKLHAIQSILLGIVFVVVDVILGFLFFVPFLNLIIALVLLLIWLYGMYAGLEAYNGRDIEMPVLTTYSRHYA